MTLLRLRTTRHNPRVLDIYTEHRQVYDAIADGRSEEAIQSIQVHLSASKRRVVHKIQAMLSEA